MNDFSQDNKSSRTPVITFLIMLGLIVFLFLSYLLMGYFMGDTIAAGSLTAEEQEKLNGFYEAKDYEGLVNCAETLESGALRILNYDHYDFLNYYAQYMEVRDVYVPKLGSGLAQNEARRLTECVFAFYYRCYDHTMGTAGNASEEDIRVLDGIRDDFMLDILFSRMGYTEDDMEAARKDIMENNYFHTAEADKFSDNYADRYR